MTFEWQPLECFEENGPITGYIYRIYHNFVDYMEGSVERTKTNLTVMHANVQAFSVAAINKAGIGEHCPPVLVLSFNLGQYKNTITYLNKIVVCS